MGRGRKSEEERNEKSKVEKVGRMNAEKMEGKRRKG